MLVKDVVEQEGRGEKLARSVTWKTIVSTKFKASVLKKPQHLGE